MKIRSNINIDDWNVDEVVNWIDKLKLSQSYSYIIKSNHINGEVLKTMKTKEDWKEIGINVFGDIRLLVTSVGKL